MIVTFDKQYKPWLCANNDDTRPALCAVWVDPAGWLFATDTNCLFVVRCELQDVPEGFNGCAIPSEWLKQAARFHKCVNDKFTIEVEPPTKDTLGRAEIITKNGTMATRLHLTGEAAPNAKKMLRATAYQAQKSVTRSPVVMFDPFLLEKVKSALGVAKRDGLVIDQKDPMQPAFAFAQKNGEAFAIVMPMNSESWSGSKNASAQLLPAAFCAEPATQPSELKQAA